MSRSPRCYVPSFVEIAHLFWWRKFLKSFHHIWAWWPSWPCNQASCHQIFNTLYLKAFIQNLDQNGTVVFEKIWFDFLYVRDLGPRVRNDPDLQYSHTFINSIRCLLLPTFRSLAAIVSEKSTVFTFSYGKAQITKFDLSINWSRSLQGYHLNKLWWAGVPNTTYQVSWKSASRFWKRRFLKGFYHIWAWRPSWSCDRHHVNKFSFPCTWKLSYKIWFRMAQ